jgi:endoribonuclease Dicer
MESPVLDQDFSPRPYQIHLFEKAVENNSIIYLPTGTGKTYIAVLLIKHLSSAIITCVINRQK